MQLKVKVQVKSQQLPLENLIRGLNIDYDRLQERAMDKLEDEARVNVFRETPTPDQMMSALHALHGEISRVTKADIPARSDKIYLYENDNDLQLQMANAIERINEKLTLQRANVPVHRDYALQQDESNPDYMYINFAKHQHMIHNYIELHLLGYYFVDLENAKTSVTKIKGQKDIVMKTGPALFTKEEM
jgi:hypothetical protein